MALSQTQGYKDYQREGKIYQAANRVISLKDTLVVIKTEIEAVYTEVDGDASADPDLKTLATQANNFVNNANFTGFITLVENQLE